ncbi:arsenate reductase ArsC [Nocardia sp. ET3-3]|uniref:Arsenate reductase ArsC n=1 Tax=Nocardia terrae TaxID=2675851 RepID=A0A7K1UV31_9NOCA|nr:arsenate reductase ArsC [Nocardia terrae]MVU78210.1 arsenate reductase ArsC [Nocardia terrae]
MTQGEAAERLEREFGAVLDGTTIERMLDSSYASLAAAGTDSARLPEYAERFARERLTALARAEGRVVRNGPTVLFVCTHNAGRSQMALGFFNRLAGDRAAGWSCGSKPGAAVNPLVVAAMAERGVDIAEEFPKPWSDELMRAADVIIDMGCGDTDPIIAGHRFEQWPLPDPAGEEIEEVRAIRDAIETRVRRLVAALGIGG